MELKVKSTNKKSKASAGSWDAAYGLRGRLLAKHAQSWDQFPAFHKLRNGTFLVIPALGGGGRG